MNSLLISKILLAVFCAICLADQVLSTPVPLPQEDLTPDSTPTKTSSFPVRSVQSRATIDEFRRRLPAGEADLDTANTFGLLGLGLGLGLGGWGGYGLYGGYGGFYGGYGGFGGYGYGYPYGGFGGYGYY